MYYVPVRTVNLFNNVMRLDATASSVRIWPHWQASHLMQPTNQSAAAVFKLIRPSVNQPPTAYRHASSRVTRYASRTPIAPGAHH